MAVGHGLAAPDDAYHAVIAKCVTRGIGYSATLPTIDQEPDGPLRFPPGVGTGPAVILPCAAVLKIAGIDHALPGISAILIWASVLTVLWLRLAREVTGLTLLLGIGIFILAVVVLFASHLWQWFTLLGEVPALAYLLMGHWLASSERTSRRSAGAEFFSVWQFRRNTWQPCLARRFVHPGGPAICGQERQEGVLRLRGVFFLGCVAATLLFEVYKLSCLGFHGYVINWQQFLDATHSYTVDRPPRLSFALVRERLELISREFSINLYGWALGVIAAWHLFRYRMAKRWPCLFAGLLISIGFSFGYWLCFSIGWPRYVVMAVGMACFALCVPIFGLAAARQKLLYGMIALLVLSTGFANLPGVWQLVQNDLFRPTQSAAREAASSP